MEFSWVQFLTGVGQFLLVAGAAFIIYCVLASHLRFEQLAEQAARGAVADGQAAQGAEAMLAARLAASSRPFQLLVLEVAGDPQPAARLAALEDQLRGLVRSQDRLARGEGQRFVAVVEARDVHGPAVLERLLRPEPGPAGAVALRGVLVSYPADKGRAADLLALADQRLASGERVAPVAPPPAPSPEAHSAGSRLLDPLTGVLRAEQVPASLQKYLARLREAELPFAIVHVDVDHLRRYNDQYGQPRGDRILKALSQFLQARLREDDLIGRLSDGDEFVIAFTATAEQALAVGRRLVTSLRRSDRDGQLDGLRVSISAGAAAWPKHGTSARHVLDAARLATRLAKARGRGQCLLAEGPPPATEYEEEVRDTL